MSKTDLIGPFRQPMNALLWPKGSHSHYKYPKSLSQVITYQEPLRVTSKRNGATRHQDRRNIPTSVSLS